MHLLFYSGEPSEENQRLVRLIEDIGTDMEIEYFQSLGGLADRLLKQLPDRNRLVLLITVADQNELTNILLLRDLLADLKIILLLPDQEDFTVAQGLTLYPRFISYLGYDPTPVASVLAKMQGNAGRRNEAAIH